MRGAPARRAPYPAVWLDADITPAHTISTGFFAFDDAADHYRLRAPMSLPGVW